MRRVSQPHPDLSRVAWLAHFAGARPSVLSHECKRCVTHQCGLIAGFHKCGQASKGAWWMPRRAEAKKDVEGCDKPRGVAKRTLIRGFPNGETRFRRATVGFTPV